MSRRRGRRLLAEEPSTAIVNMRVTPGQRLELRRVADENKTDVSGILREAVNEFVADYKEQQMFRRTTRRR